jgi:uncharacterized protein YdcH (DUF465 family)
MADYQLNVKLNGVEQAVSSVGDLEKALEMTNDELSKLDKGSKEFADLTKQSKTIEAQFKNTAASADTLNKSVNQVTGSVKNLGNTITTGGGLSAELEGAGVSAKGLTDDVNETVKASMSMRLELRKITQELQGLEPGSARFQELSLRAGELRDTIGDTNAVIGSLTGSTGERLGKAIGNTVQIGIAGFQGLSGAAALFGVEGEQIEQTMVKLTALLNVSQAIESFGGLGDKITEIRAGFTSLTGATTVQTVAQTAQTGATVTGTVATTALGVAMKALPIIAIAAAVATLVAGIYSYVTSSKEATKEEEKRKKAQEESIKAAEEQRTKIAEESGEFLLLISRLKQTNAGSDERRILIEKINREYGTTLKNLQDEGSFLSQLNLEVQDYVKFQTVRFKLDKNQERFNKLLEKQEDLQKKLTDASKAYSDEQARIAGQQEPPGNWLAYVENLRKKTVEATNALEGNKRALDNLAKSSTDLLGEQDKLTKSGDKYTDQTEKAAKAAEAQRKAEERLKDAQEDRTLAQELTKESAERLKALDEAAAVEKAKRTTTLIDDLQLEQKTAIESAQESYRANKEKIEKEIGDRRVRLATIKTLEKDLEAFEQKINEDYKNRIAERTKFELDAQNKLIADLILGRQLLEGEITVGNQDITDSLEGLLIREEQLRIKGLESTLKNKALEESVRIKTEEDIATATAAVNVRIQDEERRVLAVSTKQKIDNQETYYESTYGIAVKYNDKTKKYEIDQEAAINKRLEGETEESYKNRQIIAEKATENLNQEKLNIDQEYEVKKKELEDKFRTEKELKDAESKQKEVDEALAKWSLGLQLAQQFAQGLGEINNLINQSQDQAQTARNEAFIAGEQAKVDAIEAAYQADVANNNLTEDEKKAKREAATNAITKIQDASNKAIDKSNRELAEKQFKRQKALNIVNAVINGAQAVLQAIATFGPPPSPLGIAGIVAAGVITAAQIAAIASQKFDGGATGAPTSVSTPSVPDTTTPSASPVTSASSGGFTGFNQGVLGNPTGGAGATGTVLNPVADQRVYILESDITNTQRRVSTLESNASFG